MIEVVLPESVTRDEIDDLWAQGVNMDDWDYFISAPPDVLTIDGDGYLIHYTLDRILVGCCTNTWYKVSFRGEDRAIGVAYHS